MSEKAKKLGAEIKQLDSLIHKGLAFTVEKKGLSKILSRKKEKEFILQEFTLGVLDLLSAEFIQLQIDDEKLNENPIAFTNELINSHSKRMARIIAIAVLGTSCVVWENPLKWAYNHVLILKYTRYFYKRIKPSKMIQIVQIIRELMNLGDFISSIRLMSGVARTTLPKADLIEQSEKEEKVPGD